MQSKVMVLILALLSLFNAPAFADLYQVESALKSYTDNRSPQELDRVRKAVRQLESEGIQTKLGPVLSLDDSRLKQKVDHYIQVAENTAAPQANAASLKNIGRCFFVGAIVAVAAGCMLAPRTNAPSGYAIQAVSPDATVASAGQ